MAKQNKRKFFREEDDEITFEIMNEEAIARLRKTGVIYLPEKKVAIPKDERWNTKQMTSKILQGLQNGDSVQTMADSLKSVIGNNEASAIRNARTMVTSAENHGRLDSFKSLTDQGVVMTKEWEATPDDRTRPSHRDLDGEEQDIDKPFSNGLMFPGDGNGPAEEVWMCRCAMGSHIVGFRRADGSVSKVEYEREETLHEKQMSGYSSTIKKMYRGTNINQEKATQAFVDWADGQAYDIRFAQQTGRDTKESRYIEQLIDESNVHYSGPLYRGIMADEATANKFYAALDAIERGDDLDLIELDMLGTSSWSTKKNVAETFSVSADKIGGLDLDEGQYTPIVFSCYPSKLDKLAIDIDEFARLGQGEVIMSKKANFVVSSIYVSDDDTIYVDLDFY